MTYTEILAKINDSIASFQKEATAGETNKSAAGRARKVSQEIGKLMKEFRATSIAHHKK